MGPRELSVRGGTGDKSGVYCLDVSEAEKSTHGL